MMKRCIALLAGVIASAVLLTGCAEPAVFSEVFQLEQGQKLYTACNIWYEDAGNIDCRNIQKGSFLPVGTEIIPVETTWKDEIIFKDTKGKKYCINFSTDYRLCTMADYIGYTFTTRSRKELLKDIEPKIQARILRGEVVPGMKTALVQLAYGLPPALRTPDLRNESWVYFVSESDTLRVVLRGGVVRNVLNLNESR